MSCSPQVKPPALEQAGCPNFYFLPGADGALLDRQHPEAPLLPSSPPAHPQALGQLSSCPFPCCRATLEWPEVCNSQHPAGSGLPVHYLSSGHFVSCSEGWGWLCWLFGSWQFSRIRCFYWCSGSALCKLLSSFVRLMCAFSSRCLNRWSFGNEYLHHELAIC